MKAMILAAGKGTRLLPLTRNKPKVLIDIQGITLLEHTIRYLIYYGVDEIIVNVHHFAEQVIDFIKQNKSFGIRIEISDERDELLDTGGGLFKARWFFDDGKPFFLTASDVITNLNLKKMAGYHLQHRPLATLAVKQRPSTREFLFASDLTLCGWKNNTTGEIRKVRNVECTLQIAFSTIHVIDPMLLGLINKKGPFSMTDLYLDLAPNHKIIGYEHNESFWYESGRFENLSQLETNPEIASFYATLSSK